MIVSVIFSAALGGLVQYSLGTNLTTKRDSLRELALHLAESGAEIAIKDLQNGAVTSNFWKRENLEYEIGNYTADLDIAVIQNSVDRSLYEIHSVVTVPFRQNPLRRSVAVTVQSTSNSESEDGDPTTGQFPYAIIAQNITIQQGNGDKRPLFASYTSELTSDPVYGVDTGFEAAIVSPNSANNAITVVNAIIRGILNSGGGDIRFNEGFNNTNQVDQNLWLGMSEEDSPTGLNPDGIRNSFNGTINEPEFPDVENYVQPENQSEVSESAFWKANSGISYGIDQNFWQNGQGSGSSDLFSASGNTRNIGKTGTRTVLTTPSINLQNNAELVVRGDVVLYVKRNFNMHGNIRFEPGSTLHLIAAENNHFTGSTDNTKPLQFRVTPYVDLSSDNPTGPNIIFNNTDRIAMVIDAPYSFVNTGGQGNGNFDYMGAVIADDFQAPNGVRFFYDTTLRGGGSDDDADDIFDDGDSDYNVVSWNEQPVDDAKLLLTYWGVDV